MATIYPTGIDGNAQLPLVNDGVTPVRGDEVNNVRGAVLAIQNELGVNPSGTYGTVKDRLDALDVIVTGDGYLDAGQVSVVDVGGFYAGTNVEDILAEIAPQLGDGYLDAEQVSVVDVGGFYAGTNVEDILAEIAPQLGGGGGGDGYWTASGVDIYNNNSGNVVIGDTSPLFSNAVLSVVGANASGSQAIAVRNTDANGFGSVFVQGNRGTSAQVSFTQYSQSHAGTFLGIAAADYASLQANGASSAGMLIGVGTNTPVVLGQNAIERLRLDTSEMVVNDPSNDYDFRVESNNDTHAIFVDAGNDRVGIFNSSPGSATSAVFDINVGTYSANAGLHIQGSSTNTAINSDFAHFGFQNTNTTNNNYNKIVFINGNTVESAAIAGVHSNHGNTTTSTGELVFLTRPTGSVITERLRIDDVGTLIQSSTGTAGGVWEGAHTFNEAGADVDFRIEGNTDPNLFFVNALTDRVGIGTTTPTVQFEVERDVNGGTFIGVRNNDSGTVAVTGFFAAADTSAIQHQAYSSTNTSIVGGLTMADSIAIIDSLSKPSAQFVIGNTNNTPLYFIQDDVVRQSFTSSEVVFNDTGVNYDFRVESNTDANALIVDAGNDGVGVGVAPGSVSAKLHIESGDVLHKAHSAFTNSGVVQTTDAVQTTNATETTLASLTLSDATVYWLEAHVIARETDGTNRAFYVRSVYAYREGGSATLGSIQTVVTDESDSAWDVTFDTNSNDVRVRVTGVAATTINWACTLRYQAISGNS